MHGFNPMVRMENSHISHPEVWCWWKQFDSPEFCLLIGEHIDPPEGTSEL
jgi:hypothetical protein